MFFCYGSQGTETTENSKSNNFFRKSRTSGLKNICNIWQPTQAKKSKLGHPIIFLIKWRRWRRHTARDEQLRALESPSSHRGAPGWRSAAILSTCHYAVTTTFWPVIAKIQQQNKQRNLTLGSKQSGKAGRRLKGHNFQTEFLQ